MKKVNGIIILTALDKKGAKRRRLIQIWNLSKK